MPHFYLNPFEKVEDFVLVLASSKEFYVVDQYTQLKPIKAIPITQASFVVHFFPFELYPSLAYQG